MCLPFYAGQTRRSAPTILHLKTGILFLSILLGNRYVISCQREIFQMVAALLAIQACREAMAWAVQSL